MNELTPETTADYLRRQGWLAESVSAEVTALAWGVSNVVYRVNPSRGEPFVLKQSRGQLRTRDPWFSRLDRIWREAEIMRCLEPRLPPGVVPKVLFEDRENYLYVMEAAPADHIVWKQRLLEGTAESWIAEFLGTCLAALHRETAFHEELHEQFRDVEVFVQLRVDPFYRRVAQADSGIGPQIEQMIAAMDSHRVCVVHADFSPKNVLVAGRQIILVDYETGHYGDPAFDLGFFLSHLLLKSILHRARWTEFADLTRAFWKTYLQGILPLASRPEFHPELLTKRVSAHLAGCMWARIDGTSKVDYLPASDDQQRVRNFSRDLLLRPSGDWEEILEGLRNRLGD
jgi:aminoglycoside phosphotransferase (APT) family kinase protein